MRPMTDGEKPGTHICVPYTNKFPLSGFFNSPQIDDSFGYLLD